MFLFSERKLLKPIYNITGCLIDKYIINEYVRHMIIHIHTNIMVLTRV